METPVLILWIYIALLLVGGVMGFVKAKSKPSLIASTLFGVILALFALRVLPFQHHVWVLAALVAVFAMRLVKTKKMMPAGMMVVVTILAIVLPRLL